MALLPPRETLVGKVSNLLFPTHCCGHKLVGRMLLLKSDFRLIFKNMYWVPFLCICPGRLCVSLVRQVASYRFCLLHVPV